MSAPIIITGVPTTPGSDGAVPVRREIRVLQKSDPVQWNLFLLGLKALQSVSTDDFESYYLVAGIHGVPFKAWNGVGGDSGLQAGYCTHSSILFLPWHRPYLALFEQVLSQKMLELANQSTPSLKAKNVAAAQSFRLPYWDWGMQVPAGQNTFPDFAAGPATIQVTGVDGKPVTMENPLHHYDIDQADLNADFLQAPFNEWTTTKRNPLNDSPNAPTQDRVTTAAVNSQKRNIRATVRFILSSLTDFKAFSNDIWVGGSPGSAGSLEDVHDNIHVLVGGPAPGRQTSGHMGAIPWAAFDPIFWLHHCNVDRLFAIWQVLHPNSYVVPEASRGDTFTAQAGSREDVDTDLTPFWQDNSNFWQAKTAEDTLSFGYSYPETQSWKFSNQNEYQRSVAAAVNNLYGVTLPTQRAFPQSAAPVSMMAAPAPTLTQDLPAMEHVHDAKPESEKHSGIIHKIVSILPGHDDHDHDETPAQAPLVEHHNPGGPDHGHHANDGKYTEWVTNLKVKKHCLRGSFQVHIFVGDVPAELTEWLTHPNNVGSFAVLGSNPDTTGCAKCVSDAERGLVITGVVPLTEALLECIEKGDIRSLESDEVEPYLAKELHWRVTGPDGNEVPRDLVDDLKVSVVSTEVTLPSSHDQLPVYSGHYTLHPICTAGRPGGYSEGDVY